MKNFFFAWLAFILISCLWYASLPKSGGCDGGLCLLGPLMLVGSWGVAGIVLLAVYMVKELFRKR